MQVTEEYLKDNFLTAYFIDSERQNIEIQATSEDKKKVVYEPVKLEQNYRNFDYESPWEGTKYIKEIKKS